LIYKLSTCPYDSNDFLPCPAALPNEGLVPTILRSRYTVAIFYDWEIKQIKDYPITLSQIL